MAPAERGPTAKTATLSMLHHGEEDGEYVGQDRGNGRKEGDEGAVMLGLFAPYIRIKMRIRFSGRWKAGGGRRLQDEGVEEVGVGHRFERAMITTIMTSRFAKTYWAVLQITMTTNVNGSMIG